MTQNLIDLSGLGLAAPQFAATAPGAFAAPARGGKKAGGVHPVQRVTPPSLNKENIVGLATNLASIQKFRGGQEDFNTVLRMLDGVYSGYGRDSKSTLTDYPKVYLDDGVAQALQSIASGGGANGNDAQYVGAGGRSLYPDAKIAVDQQGRMLAPGSAMQKRALSQNDLVGTVTMGNPLNGRHGVVPGSPTYWKIYKALSGADKTNWHNRLFAFGLGDAASAAGLTPGRAINPENLSKDQKKILNAGYEANKNPEKVRLGSLAAVAQLLNTVHLLENNESSALPTSKWGTSAGKRHAALMSQEIIAGVEKFRKGEGKEIFDATGYVRYVPTSSAKAVRYSDMARGETADGRNKATQRSLFNPMNVAYDARGNQILLAKGGKTGAMSKSKTKPSTVHPAMFSGPGITNEGKFYNVMSKTDLADGGRSFHMTPGKQYDILDSFINAGPQQSKTVTRMQRVGKGRTGTKQVVYQSTTRARSTRGVPKEVRAQLQARGFSGDRGGFYAMAAGGDTVMTPYGKSWAELAEEERARDMELGNYSQKPSRAQWDQYKAQYQAYLAGAGPKPTHPRGGKAKASVRNAQNNF